MRPLFANNSLSDRGMVFGGIVAIGDAELEPFLDEIRPMLSVEEVRKAAGVHTAFLKHFTIQYWLRWAKKLAPYNDEESLGKFGACASALVLCLEYDQMKSVSDAKRDFPCTGKEHPIKILNTWSLQDYAELIAPDLYALEAGETAPRVFSHVLRAWGLQPNSPLEEQFIPEQNTSDNEAKALRDLAPHRLSQTSELAPGKPGFLAKLFDRR